MHAKLRDRRLGIVVLEYIVERALNRRERFRGSINGDLLLLAKVQRPDIVQPHDVIGVRVSEQDRIDAGDALAKSLLPEIRRCIDKYGPPVVLEHDGRAKAIVLWIFGMAHGAAATERRHTHARTGPENRNGYLRHYSGCFDSDSLT